MRLVSITEAKQNVSRLIKEVEAGETVVITRRGKPVAELKSLSPDRLDDPKVRARFEQLRRRLREWPRDGYRLGRITEEDKCGASADHHQPSAIPDPVVNRSAFDADNIDT